MCVWSSHNPVFSMVLELHYTNRILCTRVIRLNIFFSTVKLLMLLMYNILHNYICIIFCPFLEEFLDQIIKWNLIIQTVLWIRMKDLKSIWKVNKINIGPYDSCLEVSELVDRAFNDKKISRNLMKTPLASH